MESIEEKIARLAGEKAAAAPPPAPVAAPPAPTPAPTPAPPTRSMMGVPLFPGRVGADIEGYYREQGSQIDDVGWGGYLSDMAGYMPEAAQTLFYSMLQGGLGALPRGRQPLPAGAPRIPGYDLLVGDGSLERAIDALEAAKPQPETPAQKTATGVASVAAMAAPFIINPATTIPRYLANTIPGALLHAGDLASHIGDAGDRIPPEGVMAGGSSLALLEGVPFTKVVNWKAANSIAERLLQGTLGTAGQGLGEAVQEGGSQRISNEIKALVGGVDDKWEGVGEGAAMGAVLGVGMRGTQEVVGGLIDAVKARGIERGRVPPPEQFGPPREQHGPPRPPEQFGPPRPPEAAVEPEGGVTPRRVGIPRKKPFVPPAVESEVAPTEPAAPIVIGPVGRAPQEKLDAALRGEVSQRTDPFVPVAPSDRVDHTWESKKAIEGAKNKKFQAHNLKGEEAINAGVVAAPGSPMDGLAPWDLKIKPIEGEALPVEYKVVEADAIITSYTKGAAADIAELQRRNMTPEEASHRVQVITNNPKRPYDSELALNSNTFDSGAPAVTKGGIAITNTRAEAIRLIHAEHPEKSAQYRATLEGAGYNTEGMIAPMLVRVMKDDKSLKEWIAIADQTNVGEAATQTKTETAKSDGFKLLSAAENDGFNIKSATAARDFIEAIVPANQQAPLLADGGVTTEGQLRYENAVVSAVFGQEDSQEMLAALQSDGSSETLVTITRKVRSIANALLPLTLAIQRGEVGAQYGLATEMLDAYLMTKYAKTNREARDNALTNFNRDASKLNKDLRVAIVDGVLFEEKLGKDGITTKWGVRGDAVTVVKQYVDTVLKNPLAGGRKDGQTDIDGGGKAAPHPFELLDMTTGRLAKKEAQYGEAKKFGELFDEGTGEVGKGGTQVSVGANATLFDTPDPNKPTAQEPEDPAVLEKARAKLHEIMGTKAGNKAGRPTAGGGTLYDTFVDDIRVLADEYHEIGMNDVALRLTGAHGAHERGGAGVQEQIALDPEKADSGVFTEEAFHLAISRGMFTGAEIEALWKQAQKEGWEDKYGRGANSNYQNTSNATFAEEVIASYFNDYGKRNSALDSAAIKHKSKLHEKLYRLWQWLQGMYQTARGRPGKSLAESLVTGGRVGKAAKRTPVEQSAALKAFQRIAKREGKAISARRAEYRTARENAALEESRAAFKQFVEHSERITTTDGEVLFSTPKKTNIHRLADFVNQKNEQEYVRDFYKAFGVTKESVLGRYNQTDKEDSLDEFILSLSEEEIAELYPYAADNLAKHFNMDVGRDYDDIAEHVNYENGIKVSGDNVRGYIKEFEFAGKILYRIDRGAIEGAISATNDSERIETAARNEAVEAAHDDLRSLAAEVSDYANKSGADVTVELELSADSSYLTITHGKQQAKIRVADHRQLSAMHEAPDYNVSLDNFHSSDVTLAPDGGLDAKIQTAPGKYQEFDNNGLPSLREVLNKVSAPSNNTLFSTPPLNESNPAANLRRRSDMVVLTGDLIDRALLKFGMSSGKTRTNKSVVEIYRTGQVNIASTRALDKMVRGIGKDQPIGHMEIENVAKLNALRMGIFDKLDESTQAALKAAASAGSSQNAAELELEEWIITGGNANDEFNLAMREAMANDEALGERLVWLNDEVRSALGQIAAAGLSIEQAAIKVKAGTPVVKPVDKPARRGSARAIVNASGGLFNRFDVWRAMEFNGLDPLKKLESMASGEKKFPGYWQNQPAYAAMAALRAVKTLPTLVMGRLGFFTFSQSPSGFISRRVGGDQWARGNPRSLKGVFAPITDLVGVDTLDLLYRAMEILVGARAGQLHIRAEMDAQGGKVTPRERTFTRTDTKRLIEGIGRPLTDAENGAVVEFMERWNGYWDDAREMMVSSGVWSTKQAKALADEGIYIAFGRIKNGQLDATRHMRGGIGALSDPILNAMMATESLVFAATRNVAHRKLLQLARKPGVAPFIQIEGSGKKVINARMGDIKNAITNELDADSKAVVNAAFGELRSAGIDPGIMSLFLQDGNLGDGRIVAFENGKPTVMNVSHPLIAGAFLSLSDEAHQKGNPLNWWSRNVRKKLEQATTVYNPIWVALSAMPRDIIAANAKKPVGVKGILHPIRPWWTSKAHRSQDNYLLHGGMFGRHYEAEQRSEESRFNELIGIEGTAEKALRKIKDGFRYTETVLRADILAKAVKQGKPPGEYVTLADQTVGEFNQRGFNHANRTLSKALAFWQATISTTKNAWDAWSDKNQRTRLYYFTAALASVSLAARVWNKFAGADDDDHTPQTAVLPHIYFLNAHGKAFVEANDRLPERAEKVGMYDVVRLPGAHIEGVLGSALAYTLSLASGISDGTKAVERYIELFSAMLYAPHGGTVGGIFKMSAGKDQWWNDIVPAREKQIDPSAQTSDNLSLIKLRNLTGVPPRYVEAFFKNMAGVTGRHALIAADALARSGSQQIKPSKIWRGLLTRKPGMSQAARSTFEQAYEMRVALNTVMYMAQGGRIQEAIAFADKKLVDGELMASVQTYSALLHVHLNAVREAPEMTDKDLWSAGGYYAGKGASRNDQIAGVYYDKAMLMWTMAWAAARGRGKDGAHQLAAPPDSFTKHIETAFKARDTDTLHEMAMMGRKRAQAVVLIILGDAFKQATTALEKKDD